MRSSRLVFAYLLVACGGGNDVDPRVIPGGGLGDGAIDGEVNIYIVDVDDEPIANATVQVGDAEASTDDDGLVVFSDVSGPQTVVVKAQGYRSAVWDRANGANMTIGLERLQPDGPDQATLSGTINNWSSVTAPNVKFGIVFYSHSDALGDDANSIETVDTNGCFAGATCDFSVNTRTGTVSLIAAIVDVDAKGTATPDDDAYSILGWATKTGIVVEKGVNQSGLTLELVEAGNLNSVSIDFGTPPAGLPKRDAFVGIEVGDDEVVQMPTFLENVKPDVLVPKPSVFGSGASYRLTAVAQTTSGEMGAQSVLLRRGLTGTAFEAGEWLVPPTGVTATRTSATFEALENAKLHSVSWRNAAGDQLLEITLFDKSVTTIDVPSLVALPVSGALTVRAGGIGADIDLQDFSLDRDEDKIWGFTAEPVTVP
jgi:hypothetical protein